MEVGGAEMRARRCCGWGGWVKVVGLALYCWPSLFSGALWMSDVMQAVVAWMCLVE